MEWPILPLIPSRRASPHFGRYSFSLPRRVGGWVGLGGWLRIEVWFARSTTVTHPGTNQARRRVTSLIRPTPLPLRRASKLCYYRPERRGYHRVIDGAEKLNVLFSSNTELECGSMPNLMVALPNIGGALCSTPQSLADTHCLTALQ